MPKAQEEGIGVYLRIRPPPTAHQSRLLTSDVGRNTAGSPVGPSPRSAAPSTFQYEVEDDFRKSVLHLHMSQRLVQEAQRPLGGAAAGPSPPQLPAGGTAVVDDVVNNAVVDYHFRFSRVFTPSATQENVFDTVAKGCVQSVLDGMNSTVFAYGQTGSGKTYSITGGTESYHDRGLIPRAMAMIYEEVARRREGGGGGEGGGAGGDREAAGGTTLYTITMSYLQIYNDKGQDLLNHGRDARTLEELPVVSIHDAEEELLLKGLEQHSAPTLSDALNLLFLGDTNRLYCETPMNKTSSRSHCIFTIYLEARSPLSSVVRRSKLNLVDLAGSERVSKTGVSGTILTEAKHINLSLHYLEQVIVALSEKAKGTRDHVPFRNSFLTMVLRDSLGVNCKTVMLATAHVVASQVAETVSTCQFAQRVALIQQAPHVNEETDPALLVRKLRAEVALLKDEVAYLRANGGDGNGGVPALAADRVLSADEKAVCRGMVDTYVQKAAVEGDWASRLTGFNGDMARMYCCFDILRELVVRGGSGSAVAGRANGRGENGDDRLYPDATHGQQQQLLEESEARVTALQQTLQLKENELQMLVNVLRKTGNAAAMTGESAGLRLGAQSIMRYNAAAQAPVVSALSVASEDAVHVPYVFGQERREHESGVVEPPLPEQEEATLRQNIYRAALTLAQQLRRSAARGAAGEPLASGQASFYGALSSENSAQAALTRVTTLAQQGQLTDAEVTAATEFLESKRSYHSRLAGDNDDARNAGEGDTSNDARTAVDVLLDEQLVQDRAQALEAFKASYEAQQKVEETKQLLRPKYAACKATAQQLNTCVDAIKQLKLKIQRRRAERAADGSDVVDEEESVWLAELSTTKAQYNDYAAKLRQDKEDIDGMHAYLKRAQEHLVRDFEKWFHARQQQVALAVQQQRRQAQQQQEEHQSAEVRDGVRAALGVVDSSSASTPLGMQEERGNTGSPPPLMGRPAGKNVSEAAPNPTGIAASVPEQPDQRHANGLHSAFSSHAVAVEPPLRSKTASAPAAMSSATSARQPLALPQRAEGEHPPQRFASVPTALVSSIPSARLVRSVGDGELRVAKATTARLTSHLDTLAGATTSVVNGWTSAPSLNPSSSPTNTTTASLPSLVSPTHAVSLSASRPSHLEPIPARSAEQNGGDRREDSAKPNNPYFPQFPSTGNAAADAQLAELYRAREAMKRQLTQ